MDELFSRLGVMVDTEGKDKGNMVWVVGKKKKF